MLQEEEEHRRVATYAHPGQSGETCRKPDLQIFCVHERMQVGVAALLRGGVTAWLARVFFFFFQVGPRRRR